MSRSVKVSRALSAGAQLEIDLSPRTWGGARPGAGRKRKPGRRKVPHATRPQFAARLGQPVHVTLRVLSAKSGLRRRRLYRILRYCMRRSGHQEHFRICQYSIQGNHVHLICEAVDARGLARGVQGFASNMARRINRMRGQKGRVFEERYHVRVLRTPMEVRNAVAYVVNNWRRHRVDRPWAFDPYSSGELFEGFRAHGALRGRPPWLDADEPIPIAAPRSWLLVHGWKLVPPISPYRAPRA